MEKKFALKGQDKRLAARLIQAGELKEEDLERVLADYDGSVPLHQKLLRDGEATEKAVTKALAEANGMQFIELADIQCNDQAVSLLTPDQAWRLEAIPIWLEADCLTVAMADVNNVLAADELRIKSKVPVVTLLAERDDLLAALTRYYGLNPLSSRTREDLRRLGENDLAPGSPTRSGIYRRQRPPGNTTPYEGSIQDQETRLETSQPLESTQRDSSVSGSHREYQRRVREIRSDESGADIGSAETIFERSSDGALRDLESTRVRHGSYEEPPEPFKQENLKDLPPAVAHLYRLLEEAADRRMQELELTPLEHSMRIRFRQRGVWETAPGYPVENHEQVINRLRLMTGLEYKPHDIALEHKFLLPTKRGEYLCYLFVEKTETGERAVIRFTETLPLLGDPMVNIGLPRDIALQINNRLISVGGGLLFVTGPDARTLEHFYASAIRSISQSGRRDVLSLERPPQRRLPGVTSINCPTEEVLLASLANASFMHPDVIGLSSVENGTILNRAVNIAVRGSTVIACYTAPDALTAQACFTAAKVDPMNLLRGVAGHLHIVEARRLCQRCEHVITERATLPTWARTLDAPFYEPQGCEYCHTTGYHGSVYLTQYFEPEKDKPDGNFRQIVDEQNDIVAFSLGGDIDPREYSF